MRVSLNPLETDSPLLVDPDAVLPFSATFQRFQSVSWRHTQIFETNSSVQHLQFVEGFLLDIAWELSGELLLPYFLRFVAFKTYDQL